MSKKQSHSSRPDGEFVETPRPKAHNSSMPGPQGPLSRKVWGATPDEILFDGMDLLTELMHTWESGGQRVFRCEHDSYGSDSSSDEEYENVRPVTGRRK